MHQLTLQVATSDSKYASAAATTPSTTLCGDASAAAAPSLALLDSAWHASCRLTAVGRLAKADHLCKLGLELKCVQVHITVV